MQWNRAKLEGMVERRTQLHAALIDVGKRRDAAHARKAHAERRLRQGEEYAAGQRRESLSRGPKDVRVPAHLLADVDTSRAEFKRLDAEYKAAQQRWREQAQITERLVEFAEQHLDYQRARTSVSVGSTA